MSFLHRVFSFIIFLLPAGVSYSQGFIAPDTVCVNEPISITNQTQGASNYFWNFCTGSSFSTPTGVNLGNPGNALSYPVFSDIVTDNGNYYLFVANNWPGGLVRLDFGNSLLNTPVARSLGTVGGVVINTIEGLQVIKNEGKWYVIMVGGHSTSGIISRIIKITLGTDITNTNPTGTNWGNIGNLAYPIDLHMFQEGNRWYGLTLNAENQTMTRFDFSSSFDNTPTGQNLGNPGGVFSYPTGIYAINENNSWHVFVVNDALNPDLVRLDFGSSLLNTPVPVNLGNPNGVLQKNRDIAFLKECGRITAFVVNGATFDQLVRLDFGNDLLSVPTATNLGNVGNFSFPHSISELFRVGSDMYTFVTNVYSNSITRLQFGGCTNSSVPSSSLQTPPDISYNTPGIYTITQTIDVGLPTQASDCKQVVVLDKLPHLPLQNVAICQGDSVKVGVSSSVGTFLWSNGEASDSIYLSTPGYHWVETKRFGCANRDSFYVSLKPTPTVDLGGDTLICETSGNLLLDAGNAGAGFLWNTGSVSQTLNVSGAGEYFVTVTQNGCSNSDTIKVGLFGVDTHDFSYQQDVCNSLQVTYQALTEGYSSIDWDFGDGSTHSGEQSVSHQYSTFGSFQVKMLVKLDDCEQLVTKLITVDVAKNPQLILTPDSLICQNTSGQLRTAPALSFCWSPIDYLDDPLSPNPRTSTDEDITYYFTAEVVGVNLITNGDFSQGNNNSFVSDYSAVFPNTLEGQYYVGAIPGSWNGGMSNCPDHTTGAGNMMMVNGSPVSGATVWKQTVSVTPQTNYAFSTWVQSLSLQNPAQLQFSINGKPVGTTISAGAQTCIWNQFYTTWNSGTAVTAEIAIINKNTVQIGNDFALDDISFAPVFIQTDSVKIIVEKPLVTANVDTVICPGSPVPLLASGAQQYSWFPDLALSDPGVADPVASPVVTTQYIVSGTTLNGCIAKDTVLVSMFDKPVIDILQDTAICKNSSVQLWVNGGVSYVWSPASSLDDPLSSTPVASPAGNTVYQVAVTDGHNCEYTDSVRIVWRPDPVFAVTGPVQVCVNDSIGLTASGGDIYTWTPAIGMSDPSIANPTVSPGATTTYQVTIQESGCGESATLSTIVSVLPVPSITAFSSNNIDCSYDRSRLDASGARTYNWTPSTALSNPAVHNPVATPAITTTYVVAGTDRAGCVGYDSVTVVVDKSNKGGYLMPNAFTPNNDGLNDCFGIKYWGVVDEIEFSIFDRWGVRVFYSKQADACWDGTFRGVKQPAGVYVYMIKASTNCEAPVFRKGTFVLVR